MALIIPTLGVACTAFCIWEMIRIINRGTMRSPLIGTLLVVAGAAIFIPSAAFLLITAIEPDLIFAGYLKQGQRPIVIVILFTVLGAMLNRFGAWLGRP